MSTAKNQPSKLIELVRTGMVVIDADGERIGPVEYVQMGDPKAVTTRGEGETDAPWPIALGEALADTFDEPDVPEPLRSRLLRHGFIKVDGPGPDFYDTDLYVLADAITDVAGETVKLSVRKEQMIREGRGDQSPGRDTAPVPAGALWWMVNRSA